MRWLCAALLLSVFSAYCQVTPPGDSVQSIKPAGAKASSTRDGSSVDRAIDGVISDGSRWLSQPSSSPQWLEIDLGKPQKLAGIHLYSGYQNSDPLEAFVVQFRSGTEWRDIPSAAFESNRFTALRIPFDDTVDVTTDRLRLWITSTHQGVARVLEVVVWPSSVGALPPVKQLSQDHSPSAMQNEPVPLVFLNQSGFNLGKPKRFTAPTAPEGSRFEVRPAGSDAAVFSGTITNRAGDFSGFNPRDAREYVVVSGTNVSVPFRIGEWWLERVTYQGAIDFMVDSRHYVGNSRAPCVGSFGWRDDHHFGWELHTLVPQYFSNPSAYERMPRQIRYETPTKPGLWGKLAPYPESAPDIVKLIHWGADVIVSQDLLHEHLKAQLAYFLYAWPWLTNHLPAQNYQVVRDYAFAHWSEKTCDRNYPYDESGNHDLLAVKTKVGSTKGAYPPGFSVQPNLMMYEVAKREGRSDAEKFFQAAYEQAQWIVANLDWNDPQTTKGQRMSEFVTVTGLAHFLQEFPDRAPAGLKDKLNSWAEVAIRRSNNLWDFRKLDDGERWTPMGTQPTMWNEPGNVAGLPAALLAAAPFVTNASHRARLEQIVWSHFDDMFGRNPTGRHFSFDAPREVEGVEHGWYSFLPGGIGRLENARFVIDGSPKDGHYPYHPERGNYGWTEGWVQFNVAYNISLAYLAYTETSISAETRGDEVRIRLQAPLNFDYDRAETGRAWVKSDHGDWEYVPVTEESANSRFLSGRIRVRAGVAARQGDGVLQAGKPGTVEAGYGFGYLSRRALLRF